MYQFVLSIPWSQRHLARTSTIFLYYLIPLDNDRRERRWYRLSYRPDRNDIRQAHQVLLSGSDTVVQRMQARLRMCWSSLSV